MPREDNALYGTLIILCKNPFLKILPEAGGTAEMNKVTLSTALVGSSMLEYFKHTGSFWRGSAPAFQSLVGSTLSSPTFHRHCYPHDYFRLCCNWILILVDC